MLVMSCSFWDIIEKLFLNIDKKIMHQWKCRLRNIVLRLSICDVFTDEGKWNSYYYRELISWVLLMAPFVLWKLFSLIYSHLFIFTFVVFAFEVRSKEMSPRVMSGSLPAVCYSRSFMLSGLTFRFNPFWVNVYVWWIIAVHFHSFACGCPVLPAVCH